MSSFDENPMQNHPSILSDETETRLPEGYDLARLRDAISDLPVTDLEFDDGSDTVLDVRRLRVFFENGYAVSLISGDDVYSGEITFEVAILGQDGQVAYDTPITDNVMGWQNLEEIIEIMQDAANL
jgi:hypothetical protein